MASTKSAPLYALRTISVTKLWQKGQEIKEELTAEQRKFLLDSGAATEEKPE